MNPKVLIIIPTYICVDLLARVISSVLNQKIIKREIVFKN